MIQIMDFLKNTEWGLMLLDGMKQFLLLNGLYSVTL